MKTSAFLAALMASAAFLPIQAEAANPITFSMVQSAGTSSCRFRPVGYVVDRSLGPVERLSVYVAGLPPNTDFVIFNIQVPHAQFGLAWYNGDILTDAHGRGSITLVGRFSKGTFIVSQKALASPNTIPDPPGVLRNSTTGTKVDPVQIYHLGIWFNDHNDAIRAGCPGNQTPFTSNHDAGIQILNTANFNDLTGPLLNLQ